MGYHARLGPSGAYKWSVCTAAPGMEDGLSDDGNDASRQGTAEHQAASECLETGVAPENYLGRVFAFLANRQEMWIEDVPESKLFEVLHRVELDEEAIDRIEVYVNFVRDLTLNTGGTLLVEKRVPIDFITGEGYWELDGEEVEEGTPGATWKPAGGTADTIIVTQNELIVADYKSGQGRVTAWEMVRPEGVDIITGERTPPVIEPNKQLAMYAAGAKREYDWMGTFKRVRMVIVQPRLNAISEHTVSVEELDAFISKLRIAAEETRSNPQFRPGVDTCNFCKARMHCKARESFVLDLTLDGFLDGNTQSLITAKPKVIEAEWVGALYDKLDLIESFCKDVHAKVYGRLLAGEPVINSQGIPLKLVEGRAGNRYWEHPPLVESLLLEKLPEQHVYKPRELISPADAEALSKAKRGNKSKGVEPTPPVISAEHWAHVQSFIKQDPGKPSISLATDPKPAIDPRVSGFSDGTVPQPQVEDDLFS